MNSLPLEDAHGRVITNLRISLTDQCNYRCIYCMPPEGLPCLPRNSFLDNAEIERLALLFTDLGIKKIRLSGGEPLLRPTILDLVKRLSKDERIEKLALTTNGSRLKSMALPLFEAGLHSINVSLDSLDDNTFSNMTFNGRLADVQAGIAQALRVGFKVKVNMVVMKGINDHEVENFLDYAVTSGVNEVRFIEFMPLCGTGWKPQHVFSLAPVIQKIKVENKATPFDKQEDGVAKSFVIERGGKLGRVGFITTLSNPFCGACSRIRLSADGILRPCLFSHQGVALKELLRNNAAGDVIIAAIQNAVLKKRRGNEFYEESLKKNKLDQYLIERASRYEATNPSIRAIGG